MTTKWTEGRTIMEAMEGSFQGQIQVGSEHPYALITPSGVFGGSTALHNVAVWQREKGRIT